MSSDFVDSLGDYFDEFVDENQEVEDPVENVLNSLNILALFTKKKKRNFELADHLFVRRMKYTHHAIYVGNGMVIYFNPVAEDEEEIRIHTASLEEFSDGNEVKFLGQVESPLIYSKEEVVRRAKSRLCENGYKLFGNNCEQFVRWCRCGRAG